LLVRLSPRSQEQFETATKAFAKANGFDGSFFGEGLSADLPFSNKPTINVLPILKDSDGAPRIVQGSWALFLHGAREKYPADKVRDAALRLSAKLDQVPGVKVAPMDLIQRPPFDDDASSCLLQDIE